MFGFPVCVNSVPAAALEHVATNRALSRFARFELTR
jgi:hypothetical protein